MQIAIWGASLRGAQWKAALSAHGLATAAFVDSDPEMVGESLGGIPILPLREVLATGEKEIVFLIAVGAFHRRTVTDELVKAGVELATRVVLPE